MSEKHYTLELEPNIPVLPALIWAEGISPPQPTDTVPGFLAEVIAHARELGADAIPADIKRRVRRMLRHGKYHPSGRGKPASEFLLRAALRDEFPRVNCPVDVNNAISLASGLPGSIFDTGITGPHLRLRRGLPGERYVFNRSGQEIDLEDLIVVCRKTESGWEPCGNPVKDAMVTKIAPTTTDVIAVLYAPTDEPAPRLALWAQRYAELLRTECGAEQSGYAIITPTP